MKPSILILGDLLAILMTTLLGFATHGEAEVSFLPRMAVIFFPLVISWFGIAIALELFDPELTSNAKQLWLSAFAMIFAAPLAAVLRGLLLNAPIIPLFAAVLSLTSAIGMLVWRSLYCFLVRKGQAKIL